jgi:hypothetical protein
MLACICNNWISRLLIHADPQSFPSDDTFIPLLYFKDSSSPCFYILPYTLDFLPIFTDWKKCFLLLPETELPGWITELGTRRKKILSCLAKGEVKLGYSLESLRRSTEWKGLRTTTTKQGVHTSWEYMCVVKDFGLWLHQHIVLETWRIQLVIRYFSYMKFCYKQHL